MRIRFESTIDDLVAFHRFHYANSPSWRRQVWLRSLLVPGALAVMFAWMMLTPSDRLQEANDPPMWIYSPCVGVPLIALSIVWIFFVRWFSGWSLVRTVRKLFAEGPNRISIGWREMELVNGWLTVNTELLKSSLDLRAIHKIVSDGNYTFVYIAAVNAYFIPMRLYPEAEYRQFVAELRDAWENREIAIPPDGGPPQPRNLDERIVEG